MNLPRDERTPTGVMVRLLNFRPLAVDTLRRYNLAHPQEPAALMSMMGARLGYIETPCGLFVLDAEGEGMSDPLSDRNRLTLKFYPVFDSGWDFEAGIELPPLTPAQVEEFGTGEDINLAQFITRSETCREPSFWLEARYEEWRMEMERALRLKDKP